MSRQRTKPFVSCALRPLVAALALASASQVTSAAPILSSAELTSVLLRSALTASPVTNCNDDMGGGTLREAVASAANNDVIDLSTLQCSVVTLAPSRGALADTFAAANLTIVGSPDHPFVIDGQDKTRIFEHNGPGTIGLRDMYLKHGYSNDAIPGGCIFSFGNVVLRDSNVRDCTKKATSPSGDPRGGAIYAQDDVTLISSEILFGTASASAQSGLSPEGGGIRAYSVHLYAETPGKGSSIVEGRAFGYAGNYSTGGAIFSTGPTTIKDSLIAYSMGDDVGGVASYGELTIVNSTISKNTGRRAGAVGGVLVGTSGSISNSTISLNQGYGIFVHAGAASGGHLLKMYSTIAAYSSTSTSQSKYDVSGGANVTFIGSNNLIMRSGAAGFIGTISNQPQLEEVNTSINTNWCIPDPTSPALGRGLNPMNLTFDQRGQPRGIRHHIDIGSVQITDDFIFTDDFETSQ